MIKRLNGYRRKLKFDFTCRFIGAHEMRNEILNIETIQARILLIKLLKAAIAETRNLNKQLDDMHNMLHRFNAPKKAA